MYVILHFNFFTLSYLIDAIMSAAGVVSHDSNE